MCLSKKDFEIINEAAYFVKNLNSEDIAEIYSYLNVRHSNSVSEEDMRSYIRVLKQQQLSFNINTGVIPKLDPEFLKLQEHYKSGQHGKDLETLLGA